MLARTWPNATVRSGDARRVACPRYGAPVDADASIEAGPDLAVCRRMFTEFSRTTASRAPLYARMSEAIAAEADLAGLLLLAPPTQRQPVLLFACVQMLLLERPDIELARWYPNLTTAPRTRRDDPLPALRRCCADHSDRLHELLASRSTQTNEIGRCAVLLPALCRLSIEVGPLAHLDVGTSAGLNLLLGRAQYLYRPGGSVGPPSSPVVLTCDMRGVTPPITMPTIVASVGLDRTPVDVRDDVQSRWLEACVWPDQADRLERLRAAVALAREVGVDVRQGAALRDTASLARQLATTGHPVVTNTWVLNYLTRPDRVAYVDALDALGAELDLSWVFAESPAHVDGVPVPTTEPATNRTVLTVVRWRRGERAVEHLAECHPHGYWLSWY